MTPKFLVAKYAPDLRKMEPRNIGVIAWTPGRAAMRFTGVTDGRVRAPKFVTSRSAYSQWIKSWHDAIQNGHIRSADDHRTIDVGDAEFIPTLQQTARGNYFLVDGGRVVDAVKPADLDELVDYLYAELVTEPKALDGSPAGEESKMLRKAFAAAIKESGLAERPGYTQDYKLAVKIKGGKRQVFEFDAGIHTKRGRPSAVFQKVHLFNAESVWATATKFREAVEADLLDKEHCAALVYATSETASDPQARNLLDYIKTKGTVLNLNDKTVWSRIQAIAG